MKRKSARSGRRTTAGMRPRAPLPGGGRPGGAPRLDARQSAPGRGTTLRPSSATRRLAGRPDVRRGQERQRNAFAGPAAREKSARPSVRGKENAAGRTGRMPARQWRPQPQPRIMWPAGPGACPRGAAWTEGTGGNAGIDCKTQRGASGIAREVLCRRPPPGQDHADRAAPAAAPADFAAPPRARPCAFFTMQRRTPSRRPAPCTVPPSQQVACPAAVLAGPPMGARRCRWWCRQLGSCGAGPSAAGSHSRVPRLPAA